MTHNQYGVALALLLILGSSCASIDVPGETKTEGKVKDRIIGHLKKMEHAVYGCSTLRLRVTDTKVITPFDGKKFQETWTVLSCNDEHHTYELEYTVLPGGNTLTCSTQPNGNRICS